MAKTTALAGARQAKPKQTPEAEAFMRRLEEREEAAREDAERALAPPAEKMTRLTFYLPESLRWRLKTHCSKRRTTMYDFICQTLAAQMDRDDAEQAGKEGTQ